MTHFVALKSVLIPFWGQIISLSDMASQFLLANANCVSDNSDYKRVYDLCN
nr:hypothetical protein [Sedimentibacter sp.]